MPPRCLALTAFVSVTALAVVGMSSSANPPIKIAGLEVAALEGSILVDGNKRPLYHFTAEKGRRSAARLRVRRPGHRFSSRRGPSRWQAQASPRRGSGRSGDPMVVCR